MRFELGYSPSLQNKNMASNIIDSNRYLMPRCAAKMLPMLSKYTLSEFLAAIQVTLVEFKQQRDTIKDLVSRIANCSARLSTNDTRTQHHDEVIKLITPNDIELIPELGNMIHQRNPDDKYWYANLMTLITGELFRVNDIWELVDGEFGSIFDEWEQHNSDAISEYILIYGNICVANIPYLPKIGDDACSIPFSVSDSKRIGGVVGRNILCKITSIYHTSIINAIQKNMIKASSE